jgi:hypothetical protein
MRSEMSSVVDDDGDGNPGRERKGRDMKERETEKSRMKDEERTEQVFIPQHLARRIFLYGKTLALRILRPFDPTTSSGFLN